MHRLILKRWQHITQFKSNYIHTICAYVENPAAKFCTNTEEALANQFSSILQSCKDPSTLPQGRQTHAQTIVYGISSNGLLGPKILGMYVLSNRIIDAKTMFNQLDLQYALPWNWMIRAFNMIGLFEIALLFYFKMLGCKTLPDKYTFPYVIKSCGGLKSVSLCKYVHRMIRITGFETDLFVGSCLIKFYAENNHIDNARILFDKMPEKDHVLWNVMLNGYAKNKDLYNMIDVYKEMRNSGIMPNSVTFACILSACASQELLHLGTQLQGTTIQCGLELDSPVANTLLALYAKCRVLSDARKLFEMTPKTDLVTWNGMISGYVQNGFIIEASKLFHEMIISGTKPDSITFASFLPTLFEPANLNQGKQIQCYVIRHGLQLDAYLKSALIDLYLKCREVKMAQKIFNQSNTVDVVIYTAMISGYVLNGMCVDAVDLFRSLLHDQIRPNSGTLASVLPACAGLTTLKLGKELHCYILKHGHDRWCYVGSAITDMYAKCGNLDLSYNVFLRMSEKDAISWNSMITSCSQNGKPEEAMNLFRQMGTAGIGYDCVTISAALSASANLPAINYGKEIHAFLTKFTLSSDIFTESALIDMYGKCGNLDLARRVFNTMREKSEVSWNSMIAAYGNHGRLEECLDMFREMLKDGIAPDHVTFLAIISACGHAGKVDKGIYYFHHMKNEYDIKARMEHYACLVDLLGRCGRLNEALEVITSMPFDPDAVVWGTLLGACRVHGNVELAEMASQHLFELDPQNSGYYVLLANVHAYAGQWGSVDKIRSLMKDRKVHKIPGYSWIEVNGNTHMFVSSDTSHLKSVEIYCLLKKLLLELRREGYEPQFHLPNS